MRSLAVHNHQRTLIKRPIKSNLFLEGPAGTGKTTAGVGRLKVRCTLEVRCTWPGVTRCDAL